MANTKITNRVLDKTVITGQAEVTAADADHILIYDASATALKKALVSDLLQTNEEIQDIIGAMFSSNTETGIAATYVDGGVGAGKINLVIGDDTIVSSMLDTNITIAGTLGVAGVLTGASLDISGDIDVDGTTNLDVVDIDGAVNMASTLSLGGDISMNDNQIIFNNNSQAILIKDAAGTASYVFYQDNADTLIVGNGTNVEAIRFDTGGNEGALTIDTSGNSTFGGNVTTTAEIAGGLFKVGSTTVLDGSRNLTNIGTIGSGAITTSGNLTASQSVLSIINNDIRLKTSGDETMLRAVANGAVELMHNNIPRVTTTATGVFLGNGTANTNFELDLKGVASKATRIQFQEGGANKWLLGQGAASETTAFELFNAVGTIALSVSRSSSVATFAAGIAITAGDLVIPNSIVHAGDTDTKLDFNQADTMRLITGDTTAWICNGSSMVVNEDGVDRDFRVESDDNANMLFVDGNANKVGIGTNDLGAVLNIATADGTTNDVVNSIMITNKSTGTTTTGFGGEIRFQAQRNNGGIQNTGRIASVAEVNSGTTISSGLGLWTSVGGSLFERVRITNTGLLSIANNNNTHNFKANAGSSNSWFGVYDDGNDSANIEIRRSDTAQVFYVLGHTGNYHFAGSDVSDRDLKENIAYIPDGSLELVKQLKPRTYNFKSSEGFVNSSRTGFIAQEVADVMTTDHRVASGTDGDKDMGISPVGLIAHLTKAIQEQQTLIESLTARIETLEG